MRAFASLPTHFPGFLSICPAILRHPLKGNGSRRQCSGNPHDELQGRNEQQSNELTGLSQAGRLVISRLSIFARPREDPGDDFLRLEVIETGHLVTRELAESLNRVPPNLRNLRRFPDGNDPGGIRVTDRGFAFSAGKSDSRAELREKLQRTFRKWKIAFWQASSEASL